MSYELFISNVWSALWLTSKVQSTILSLGGDSESNGGCESCEHSLHSSRGVWGHSPHKMRPGLRHFFQGPSSCGVADSLAETDPLCT